MGTNNYIRAKNQATDILVQRHYEEFEAILKKRLEIINNLKFKCAWDCKWINKEDLILKINERRKPKNN